MNNPCVLICRAIEFNGAHRYANAKMTAEENRALYGSLFSAHGWGRRFRLEVSIAGPVDPLTGMIVNLVEIDRWLGQIVAQLSECFLNDLSDVFEEQAPTAERITAFCFRELTHLAAARPSIRLKSVRLFEDESLSVTLTI